MSELRFENTRFDPDLTPFHGLAKDMAQAFGYTADLSLDKALAQLVRLRVSQLNRCAYCTILHAKTARDVGIESAKIDNLGSYWEGNLYSDVEKVALAYCDALTSNDPHTLPQAHASLSKHFDANAIAELAAVVINMNVWTRLKLAQGAVPMQGS